MKNVKPRKAKPITYSIFEELSLYAVGLGNAKRIREIRRRLKSAAVKTEKDYQKHFKKKYRLGKNMKVS